MTFNYLVCGNTYTAATPADVRIALQIIYNKHYQHQKICCVVRNSVLNIIVKKTPPTLFGKIQGGILELNETQTNLES